jgi:hypothetical protein
MLNVNMRVSLKALGSERREPANLRDFALSQCNRDAMPREFAMYHLTRGDFEITQKRNAVVTMADC